MKVIPTLFLFTILIFNGEAHLYDVIKSYELVSNDPNLQNKLMEVAQKVSSAFTQNFYGETFTEANETGLTAMRSCMLDMAAISSAVLWGETWPWKFFDASAKIPPGMSGGDLTWIGSYEMCNQIIANHNGSLGRPIHGRYCNVRLPIIIDDPDVAIDLGITIGMCLPASCDTGDLVYIAEKIFGTLRVKVDERYTYCHHRGSDLPKDDYFNLAVVVGSVLLAFVIAGSLMDAILYAKWSYNFASGYKIFFNSSEPELQAMNTDSGASSTEPNTPSETEHRMMEIPEEFQISYVEYRGNFFDKYCICGGFLLVFSFPHNLWKLWNAKPPETVNSDGKSEQHPLACLEGLRVITLAWIIYIHNFTYQTYYINNALIYKEVVVHDIGYQLIRNGSFTVDTFFLISGLLACYILIPIQSKIKGCCRKLLFWIQFAFHRFIRIAPSWFIVTILFTGFFPYVTDGPVYPQNPEANDELRGCRDHWWITFLNNFFYTERPCMLWTWYLSNDFQFSVVLTPIFVTLLAFNTFVGVLFAVALVISSCIATFIITYQEEYGPSPIPLISFGPLYVKPYTRWGSYAIGMLLAWVLRAFPVDSRKYSTCKRILITTVASIFAAVLTLLVLFGLYGRANGDLPPLSNSAASIYAALSRPAWTLGIAICVYLCATKFSPLVNAILSFSFYSVFSKLNYCAYLIHPILIMYYQQSRKRTESFDSTFLLFSFAAVWLLSYVVATVVSMSTEVPAIALGKLMNRQRRPPPREEN